MDSPHDYGAAAWRTCDVCGYLRAPGKLAVVDGSTFKGSICNDGWCARVRALSKKGLDGENETLMQKK